MYSLHAEIRNGAPVMFLDHAGHFTPEWGDEFAAPALASIAAQQEEKRRREAEMAAAEAEPADGNAEPA